MYYPLSTLMPAGIRDNHVIPAPHDTPRFREMSGDGKRWGLRLQHAVQPKSEGIAQAFLGRNFIDRDSVALVLGDNVFCRYDSVSLPKKPKSRKKGATLFVCPVENPQQFGVVEFNDPGQAMGILEASQFIETIERRQGLKITGPEAIARRVLAEKVVS